MSKLAWTEENLPTLGTEFLRKVIGNMNADSVVRFGLTGQGVRPNYQVTSADNHVRAINSASHEEFAFKDINVQEFEPSRISEPFSLGQVAKALHGATL